MGRVTQHPGYSDAVSIKLFLVTIVIFCHLFSFTLLIPVEPQYVSELYGGKQALKSASFFLGWISAGRAFLELFSNPVMGSLSDCFGRRSFMLLALVGSFAENLVKCLFPTLNVIALATIATGSIAGMLTVAMAYITDLDPENVSKNLGLVGVALGFAFISGPVLGGTLGVENIRAAYSIAAGIELVSIAIVLVVLTESHPEERRPEFSPSRANPFAAFGLVLRSPLRRSLAAAVFFFLLAQNLNVIWALYTKYRFDWGSAQLGAFLGCLGIVAVISNGVLLRMLLDHVDDYRAAIFGLASSITALVLYGLASYGWMMYVFLIPMAAAAVAEPILRGLLSKHTELSDQGELQGALSSLQTMARIIGPLIATSLFGHFISDEAAFKLPGAPFFAFAFLQLFAVLFMVFSVPKDVGSNTLRHKEEAAGIVNVQAPDAAGEGAPAEGGGDDDEDNNEDGERTPLVGSSA